MNEALWGEGGDMERRRRYGVMEALWCDGGVMV